MATEDVIAAALADAREAGDVEPAESEGTGVDEVVETDDAVENDGADGEEGEKPAAKVEKAGEDDEEEEADIEADKKPVKKAVKVADDTEEPDAEKAKADKAKADAEADKKKTDEEEEEAELGPERNAKGKVNLIPHPKVQKIVKNAEGKFLKEVVTGLGLDPAVVTREKLPTVFTNIKKHVKGLQDRVAVMNELGPIMEKDAKAFITRLAETWPTIYNPVLDALNGKGTSATGSATVAEPDGEEPGPDVDIELPDGSKGKTFSVAGMAKRDAYRDAKLTARIMADVKKELGDRFKPLDDAKAKAEKAAAAKVEVEQEMHDILEDAATWDGFKEHEKEIFEAWQASDPSIPMRKAINAAYQKVVVAKYKQAGIDARKKALEELAAAPDGTAAVSRNGKPQKEVIRGEGGEVVTGTEAIIRRELAKSRARA